MAYQNRPISEQALAQILGTQPYGTPISQVNNLKDLDCRVIFRSFSAAELRDYLQRGVPVIARVWTGMLTYWAEVTFHVVVVVGYDEEQVFLNDPAFVSAPQVVLWDSFLAAWAEYDEVAVVIQV